MSKNYNPFIFASNENILYMFSEVAHSFDGWIKVKLQYSGSDSIQEQFMNNITIHQLAIGDTITYVLPSQKRATDTAKEYQGVITHIFPQAQMVYVTVLTEGYEGMNDQVYVSEIISVTKPGRA